MDPLESLKAAFPPQKASVDGSSFGVPLSPRLAGSHDPHPAHGFIYPATSFGAASGPGDIGGSIPEIRVGADLVDPFTREVTMLPGRGVKAASAAPYGAQPIRLSDTSGILP